MPAAIRHETSPTTRPAAWRLMVAVVAFVAYLLAGMHLACADDCARLPGGDITVGGLADDGGPDGGQVAPHCCTAHLQADGTASAMPRPEASASLVRLRPEPRHASAERERMEDPPRS